MAFPRAIPLAARLLTLGATFLLTAVVALDAGPAAAAPAAVATSTTVDPRDRASVAAAYRNVYLPSAGVTAPTPAADTLTHCRAGVTPDSLQDATLSLVNYFRAMSGVGPVTFDPTFSAKAQQAALIGYANGVLNHAPTESSKCWSAAGAEGAAHSDLGLGYRGADVVRAYMDDAGAENVTTGHRWWLQRPSTQTMGNGTVGTANALWVVGSTAFTDGPLYTSWPSAGYVPAALEPRGRWSLTAWDPDYDLGQATVAVTGPDGRPVRVAQAPVNDTYGSLVFDLGTLPAPTGSAADTYTVSVTGILKRGEPISRYRYQVSLFDPTADVPLEAAAPLALSGTAEVGQTLRVSEPRWSSPAATTSYQWFRGRTAIPGATGPSLLLGAADIGEEISVTATGTTPGRSPATITAGPSAAVRTTATVRLTASSPDQGAVHLAVAVSADGDATPTGAVEITEGATVVAREVALVNGAASVNLTGVSPGPHVYTARFLGSSRVTGGLSPSTPVTVGGPVAAQLVASASSPAVGRLVLTVHVTAPGEPAPNGRLEVRESGVLVGTTATVTAGQATWTASKLRPGRHALTVQFLGTERVAPASTPVTVTVRAKVRPTVKVRATSPSKRKVALAVTVKAKGQPALGGTVKIKEGSKTLAARVAVRKGVVRWSAIKRKPGKRTYTVIYSGTSKVLSRSAKVKVTVKK